MPPLQTIRNLKPRNKGGVIARSGFGFQDHIALHFCLEMVSNHEILEVWCEAHDDITVIRCVNNIDEVEFIQVKDLDLNQLWSVSKLCHQEDNKKGASILEKSMDEERCKELCHFRIITSLEINKDLEVLKHPFTSVYRLNGSSTIDNLA